MTLTRPVKHIALLLLVAVALAVTCTDDLGARDGVETDVNMKIVDDVEVAEPTQPAPSHPSLWYDDATFFQAVRDAQLTEAHTGVAGAIIPHHWLAGHLITGLFASLAASDGPPRAVILVGPNHTNAGGATALTSDRPWSTPVGVVEPAMVIIDALMEDGLVSLGGAVLTPEHSVAGIMPAIAYYLPEARVAPVILAGDAGPADAQRIARTLAPLLDEETVLVAAVDFSHYLTSAAAQSRDEETVAAIRSLDGAALFAMNNDHLDSPSSIAVLLDTMRATGHTRFELTAHTNSGVLARDELSPTTSYFAGWFYRSSLLGGSEEAAQ